MRPRNVLAADLPVGLDRAAHLRRDADSLRQALDHPEASILLVWRSRTLTVLGDRTMAARVPMSAFGDLPGTERDLVFLGLGPSSRSPVFSIDLSDADELSEEGRHPLLEDLQPDARFTELREVAAVLDAEDANLLATARALASWHRNHLHCGRCGEPTEVRDAGHLRHCPSCAHDSFPRTDPAVIMLVHDDGDHCLLGRQASWPAGVYSTLAGFVEPGESLEMAVAREVQEETGVIVDQATYHSSQPWPFPTSIMLGFWARAVPGAAEIAARDEELEDARWFSIGELRDAMERREVRLPPPMSIARRLVDDWLASREG